MLVCIDINCSGYPSFWKPEEIGDEERCPICLGHTQDFMCVPDTIRSRVLGDLTSVWERAFEEEGRIAVGDVPCAEGE